MTFLQIAGETVVSPDSGPNDVAEVQAHLDDEIAALSLTLSNLRTRRNSLSPISRVPPEILASVFVHCARAHQQNPCPGCRVPDWVNVSHVCRHWRDIALNCSTLWSFLFVSSQRWTDELLVRSKMAPLNVRVDSEYPKQSKELNLLRKVAPQADRIQNLSLRLTRQEAERVLSLFSSPAPLLQTLHISVESSNYLDGPALGSGVLFDGDTPALRKLELINYTFPLASSALGGLTFLRLRDLGTSFQPTFTELMVALDHMQALSHLHLENALPSARGNSADQSFGDSKKLSFPQLSRLSIVAPFSTVVLLLSCLDLPMKTEVRLRCCFEPGAEDYPLIYPLLAKRFVAPNDEGLALVPVIHTSFIETTSATVGFIFSTAEHDSGRRAFSASTTTYELGQLCEDWDCNIPLKVDIALRTSLPRDRECLVEGIFGSLPLTSLQSAHLSFDMGTTLSSAFWKKTFGHLKELRHVKLSNVDLQGLVQALSFSPYHCSENTEGRDMDPSPDQIFAPSLEELELHMVNFSKKCYGRSQGNLRNCSCSVQCLNDALSNRQTEGHGIRRLVFTECMYLHDCNVEGLKGLVTDVDWDGVTRTIPGPENEEGEAEGDESPRDHFAIPHGHFFRRNRW